MKIAIAGGTGVVGRHVVEVAETSGHETVILSRSHGVDLVEGSRLDEHLTGVDAVIDTASVQTMSASTSMDFFRTVTQHLVTAGRRCGVGHHVALSIIGANEAPFSYYAGKRVQENLVLAQPNGTVVRAAQFHEFCSQTLERTALGPLCVVPTMRSQPVAAGGGRRAARRRRHPGAAGTGSGFGGSRGAPCRRHDPPLLRARRATPPRRGGATAGCLRAGHA